jgi:hypothetical protein
MFLFRYNYILLITSLFSFFFKKSIYLFFSIYFKKGCMFWLLIKKIIMGNMFYNGSNFIDYYLLNSCDNSSLFHILIFINVIVIISSLFFVNFLSIKLDSLVDFIHSKLFNILFRKSYMADDKNCFEIFKYRNHSNFLFFFF